MKPLLQGGGTTAGTCHVATQPWSDLLLLSVLRNIRSAQAVTRESHYSITVSQVGSAQARHRRAGVLHTV